MLFFIVFPFSVFNAPDRSGGYLLFMDCIMRPICFCICSICHCTLLADEFHGDAITLAKQRIFINQLFCAFFRAVTFTYKKINDLLPFLNRDQLDSLSGSGGVGIQLPVSFLEKVT